MQHDANALPPRITLATATELAGYKRRNTIREKFLATAEDRARLDHGYNHLGEGTIDTKRFLEALEKSRSEDEARGNWRLKNLELANAKRAWNRARTRKQKGRS